MKNVHPWKGSDEEIKRSTRNSQCPKGDKRNFGTRECSVCKEEFQAKSSRAALCKDCKLEKWINGVTYGIDEC